MNREITNVQFLSAVNMHDVCGRCQKMCRLPREGAYIVLTQRNKTEEVGTLRKDDGGAAGHRPEVF